MKTVSKKLLSLLLVAILLISAVPMQAFAMAHDAAHTVVDGKDATGHWKVCGVADCDEFNLEIAGTRGAHTFGGDGKCTACGFECPHNFAMGVCAICGYACPHTNAAFTADSNLHWKNCPTCNATQVTAPEAHVMTPMHDANQHWWVCTICNYTRDVAAHNFAVATTTAATCTTAGVESLTCIEANCGFSTTRAVPAKGHTDPDGDKICNAEGCGAWLGGIPAVVTGKLTLDSDGGNCAANVHDIAVDMALNTFGPLPTPVKQGWTFAGWYLNDTTYIENGTVAKAEWGNNPVAKAHWTQNTNNLIVKVSFDDGHSIIQNIFNAPVTTGTPLLTFLQNNETIQGAIKNVLNSNPGYFWYGEHNDDGRGYFYDYSGSVPLTAQDQKTDQAQTVLVRIAPRPYTVYFEVGAGATVEYTSKLVTFNKPIGSLPFASKNGYVLCDWADMTNLENGIPKAYNSASIYNQPKNITLTARWAKQEAVVLHIYMNGVLTKPECQLILDGYSVKNAATGLYDHVTRAAVEKIITARYSGNLVIDGLYDDYTWESYKKNTSKPGSDNIQVNDGLQDGHPVNVYVMVRNAYYKTSDGSSATAGNNNNTSSGSTSSTSNTSSSSGNTSASNTVKYSTNPKTGDQVMIEAAVTVMVLAAAGYVTLITLRKKEII